MEGMKSARKNDGGEVGRYQLAFCYVCFTELLVLLEHLINGVFVYVLLAASDLSEQIKASTKETHVRAENTELMLSYQKGQITLPQYKVQLHPLNNFSSVSVYTVLI